MSNPLLQNGETVKEVVERARKWVESPEGIARLNEIAKRQQEFARQLEEESRVSWEDMLKPMTI